MAAQPIDKDTIPKLDNLVVLQVLLFVFGFIVPISWGVQLGMFFFTRQYIPECGRVWAQAGATFFVTRTLLVLVF